MKADIEITLQSLSEILLVEQLSAQETRRVIDETSLASLRKRAEQGDRSFYWGAGNKNSQLFHKGEVGGYRDYFNSNNLNDLSKISKGQISSISRLYYNFAFTLRRKLFF